MVRYAQGQRTATSRVQQKESYLDTCCGAWQRSAAYHGCHNIHMRWHVQDSQERPRGVRAHCYIDGVCWIALTPVRVDRLRRPAASLSADKRRRLQRTADGLDLGQPHGPGGGVRGAQRDGGLRFSLNLNLNLNLRAPRMVWISVSRPAQAAVYAARSAMVGLGSA